MSSKIISSIRSPFKLAACAGLAAPMAAQAATLGAFSATFAPWMLAALPATYALWYLMKNIPQQKLRQIFSGVPLLKRMKQAEPIPASSPPWHKIPLLLAALAVTAALTKPEKNLQTPLMGTGPVMQVIDNGWLSARNWDATVKQVNNLIDRAERAGRPVTLLPTAPAADGSPVTVIGPLSPEAARQYVKDMKPQPWPTKRDDALKALEAINNSEKTSVFWLSNGLNDEHAPALSQKLQSLGALTILEDDTALNAHIIDQPSGNQGDLSVTVRRSQTSAAETVRVTARKETGDPLETTHAEFKSGESSAQAIFKGLNPAVRNEVTSVTLDDKTAGARVLIDERFRRRPVGIMQANGAAHLHPLENEAHFVATALEPFTDVYEDSLDNLLKRKVAVLAMVDSASVGGAQAQKIEKWVKEEGGTLLRFAGPRLAAQPASLNDPLLPLRLRPGSRTLGGTVSGTKEARIKAFPAGPLAGIAVPDNVTIKQHVITQGGVDSETKIWAWLDNDTPLVSSKKHGKGQIILVHTTADPSWTNGLSYSELFMAMNKAIIENSQGVADKLEGGEVSLPAYKILDAQGRLANPSFAVQNLKTQAITDKIVGPRNPPGFYGTQITRYAHNLSVAVPELKPMSNLTGKFERKAYEAAKKDTDYTGIAWAAAFAAMMAHLIIMTKYSKGSGGRPTRKAESVLTKPSPDM